MNFNLAVLVDVRKPYSRSSKFFDVIDCIQATQLAMPTSPDVCDVLPKLQKTNEVFESTHSITSSRRRVKRRNALAQLVNTSHSAVLHARRKRVRVVFVVVEFDFIWKNALALGNSELSGIIGCISLLHRDQQFG